MKLLQTINPEHTSAKEIQSYRIREAARAVVFDDANNVALLYIKRDNYYKLPGGGIEAGEDHLQALRRECQEEIGCDVEVTGELGCIIEYRKFCTLVQTSYCYVTKLTGQKGAPTLTDEEIEEESEHLWLPYQEALDRLRENNAKTIEGKLYIVPRDVVFLEMIKA